MVESDTTSIKVGHALGARNETKTIADEFRALVRKAGVRTPSIDILYRYLDRETEPAADGNSDIPVRWRAVWIVLGGFAVFIAMLLQLMR